MLHLVKIGDYFFRYIGGEVYSSITNLDRNKYPRSYKIFYNGSANDVGEFLNEFGDWVRRITFNGEREEITAKPDILATWFALWGRKVFIEEFIEIFKLRMSIEDVTLLRSIFSPYNENFINEKGFYWVPGIFVPCPGSEDVLPKNRFTYSLYKNLKFKVKHHTV